LYLPLPEKGFLLFRLKALFLIKKESGDSGTTSVNDDCIIHMMVSPFAGWFWVLLAWLRYNDMFTEHHFCIVCLSFNQTLL